jgi:hypothetical protein
MKSTFSTQQAGVVKMEPEIIGNDRFKIIGVKKRIKRRINL